ncbi:MAG: hypothetical protein AAF235_00550, partial [Planctomycetota bacterium]
MSDLHLDPGKAKAWTRRSFLERSLVFTSAALSVPAFVQRSAWGIEQPAMDMGSIPGVPEDRVLVILQLSGGNDGLNTVVPHGFDEYYRARPQIGVRGEQTLALGRGNQAIGLCTVRHSRSLCCSFTGEWNHRVFNEEGGTFDVLRPIARLCSDGFETAASMLCDSFVGSLVRSKATDGKEDTENLMLAQLKLLIKGNFDAKKVRLWLGLACISRGRVGGQPLFFCCTPQDSSAWSRGCWGDGLEFGLMLRR